MMAKSRGYNFSRVILTLYVCLVPVLGSVMDEKAVIYTSFCVLAAALGYNVYKTGEVEITKTTIFFAIVSLYSYLQLLWVSDKGSQMAFATLFLCCTIGSMLASQYKPFAEDMRYYGLRMVYIAAIVYSVCAFLSQVFVESQFWGCNMDMGNLSPTAAAFITLAGMVSGIKLFSFRAKSIGFLCAMTLMAYVFLMTKSLPAFLCAAILLFVYTMRLRHKRVEAFFALVVIGVLAIANVISVIYNLATGKVVFDAFFKGLGSVGGMGSGGYNTIMAVVDGGYKTVQITLDLLGEAYGFLGIALAIFAALVVVHKTMKAPSFRNLLSMMAVIMLLLTSSEALVFALPVLAIYYGYHDQGRVYSVHELWGAAAVLPIGFFAMLAAARGFYLFGQDALDKGEYENAAGYYTTAAKMELFNSEGWEKAYSALRKDYTENGTDNLERQKSCLSKASAYNKENYKYHVQTANIYTNQKKYRDALKIYDSVIAKNDKQYLYPQYTQKIYDVMKNLDLNLSEAEALYKKIEFYAKKCTDMETKIKVNNILTQSQKYYINAREGGETAADMYEYREQQTPQEATDAGGDL